MAGVIGIVFGAMTLVGLYFAWIIVKFGFDIVTTIGGGMKYDDGDEYGDEFYVQMPDGSVRID